MVERWPRCLDEFETLRKLAEGYSIGRIGDGEVKLMTGGDALREPRDERLRRELGSFVRNPHPKCLVGILTMNPQNPKHEGLSRYADRLRPFLDQEKTYASAHISRVDHAPWIDCPEYAELAMSIWRDKRAVVVAEMDTEPAVQMVMAAASYVSFVPCPHREAYAEIDRLEQRVLEQRPGIVVLSAGPMATCLAGRLACQDVQAIDVGRMGKVVLRHAA